MKKLQLFSLLWLTGLFAFSFVPAFAQDAEEVIPADEEIVAAVEDVDPVAAIEDSAVEVNEEVEAIADEVAAEVEDVENAVEDTADDVAVEATEQVEDLSALLNTEEVQNAFSGFTTEETAWIIWIFAGMWIAGFLVVLVLAILGIIALWRAFTRAWEGWWKAIIPIYNTYIQFKLADMKNWFWYMILIAFAFGVVAACIPSYEELISNIAYVVARIIGAVASFKFARKYGWWVFAAVLFALFYPICILVLGFGNYPYEWKKSEETIVEA